MKKLINLKLHKLIKTFNILIKTMLLYFLNCRKSTKSENTKVVRTKNGRIMLLSKCAVSDSKKSKSIKDQEASGLLSSFGIKTPLTLFKIGLFRAAHGCGKEKKGSPP